METLVTLKVSPQGQVTIPKSWRKALNLGKKSKLIASVNLGKVKQLCLKPEPKSWVKQVAGTGKGLWGNSDEYIQKERDSWRK